MSQASIIQVSGTTAGIVVGWQGNVRFFSAQSAFDTLDGRIFRSVAQAQRAAAAAPFPPRPVAPPASSQDLTA
jgi:hypothetical protein